MNAFSATKNVIRNSEKQFHGNNKTLTVGFSKTENQSGYTLLDTVNLTPNELHISRHDDMQGKETQKVLTLLRNGRNLKTDMGTNVFTAINARNLPKTILSHYQKGGAIISPISNLFVAPAIVGSGRLLKSND